MNAGLRALLGNEFAEGKGCALTDSPLFTFLLPRDLQEVRY